MVLFSREKALPISFVGEIIVPSIWCLVPLILTLLQVESMARRYSMDSEISISTSRHITIVTPPLTVCMIQCSRSRHDAFYVSLKIALSGEILIAVGCVDVSRGNDCRPNLQPTIGPQVDSLLIADSMNKYVDQ